MEIKVLGAGCKSCHQLFEQVKDAVDTACIDAEVEYVTDMQTIAGYGIMRMPAIVVDGKVVSSGKVLKPAAVKELLK